MTQRPFAAVIMAGGQGTRFWPLSTPERPKQFLDLERTGRTLLQATYDRLLPLTGGPQGVYVATAARYRDLVREQLPDLPLDQLLVEPSPRDSGPAVAFAALTIHRRTGGATLGFFSSDHRIADADAFRAAVRRAIVLAESERGLVTLGIAATHASTAYGYIQRGEAVADAFRVARFVEKPNADRARQYLADGGFDWNAGIFVWRSDVILEELAEHAPDIAGPLLAAADDALDDIFPTLPRRSIDYAVMEHTRRAFVVPVDCGWDDIGDWVALERLLARDADANTVVGTHVGLEASGNVIYTDGPDDVVVTVGVHDLVVVKQGDTVLLVAKDRIGELKRVLGDERLADLLG